LISGHGTFFEHEITESEESTNQTNNMLASVCGTVQRVNKLISVLPVKSRYEPEIGDLIVGRITEVGAKRWRVDIRSRQDAILLLSSVTLPGGIQVFR
jgi:exosome complex component RRP4